MTPQLFREMNELLARLIHAPDTSEAMRKAAKKARQALLRHYGIDNDPATAHNADGHNHEAKLIT